MPDALKFSCADGTDLDTVLTQSETDCMVILHRGKKIWQWSAAHCEVARPHVVFSISKSITAMMTGILVGNHEQCYMALGIHGQWLYINPSSSVVIAKLSTQPEPVDDDLDFKLLEIFAELSHSFDR